MIAQAPRRATFAQVARTYHQAVLHFEAACRAHDRALVAMVRVVQTIERRRRRVPRA
ncbi:MAG TPA: hypothetical protein VK595_13975 [Vicinamibacterales bacterium]|nr:hypothetical protein [Vicinamibacterales bacterium]